MNAVLQPDFEQFRKAVMRQGQPAYVPLAEANVDLEVMSAFLGKDIPDPRSGPLDLATAEQYVKLMLEFWRQAGYDYYRASCRVPLAMRRSSAPNTAQLANHDRQWVDQNVALITSWEEFEKYPWPDTNGVNYQRLEQAARLAPEGMKNVPGICGVLEYTMWIMGYENFAYSLYDDPALVEAVVERIGRVLESIFLSLATIDGVGALLFFDDLGYRTGTLIAPEHLKKYFFPWHKRMVDIAHSHGLPVILHACGNCAEVMEDIIALGYDAKHAFEDAIISPTEAKKKYGDRIAIIGGLDVDFLSRRTPEEIRKKVREVMHDCAPDGGFCLGSGNSVTNYVPLENYVAMLDEAMKTRRQ